MLDFAVEVELDGVVIFGRGHHTDVPDFEQLLQVFFVDKLDVFDYSGDGGASIKHKITQLRILPTCFKTLRRRFGTRCRNHPAPKCGKSSQK